MLKITANNSKELNDFIKNIQSMALPENKKVLTNVEVEYQDYNNGYPSSAIIKTKFEDKE